MKKCLFLVIFILFINLFQYSKASFIILNPCDYEGNYGSEYDTNIKIIKTKKNKFNMEIVFYRLTSIEAKAYCKNKILYFKENNIPGHKSIEGIFKKQKNCYELTITNSDFSYLKNGQTFCVNKN